MGKVTPMPGAAKPPILTALLRGLRDRCPNCGRGRLLHHYLKTVDRCDACGEPYAHLRADDAAPWLTIIVLAHIIVPSMLLVTRYCAPPALFQELFWPALTIVLVLLLLPRSQGAVLALIWVLRSEGSQAV